MKFSKVRLLVIDWSGCVSNDKHPVYKANIPIFNHYGITFKNEEEFFREAKENLHAHLKSKGIEEEESFLREWFYKNYVHEYLNGNTPFMYENVDVVLRNLRAKGIELAVLSSHPFQNLIWEAMDYGIKDLFSAIKSSSNKTEDLEWLCKLFERDKDEAMYFGDTTSDMIIGKKVEVSTAASCWGYHDKEALEKENPDLLLENISELPAILNI